MLKELNSSFDRLKEYCERENYRGYDPFDGLTSPLFQSIPGIRSNRIMRLSWIQFFKRSPVNLRPLVGVRKGYNPKALGLFLSGYCNLYQVDASPEYIVKMKFLVDKIMELKSNGWSGACWGYNFDWQARAFFQPKYTPTVVASTYVANALLDAYEITADTKCLEAARSTCDFILNDLNRGKNEQGDFAFSYSPLDKSVVFNASLLGSRLLARVASITGEDTLKEEAERSVRYCCRHQKADGSWPYGLATFHQWVDNFHTGYNLECISDFMKYTGNYGYKKEVAIGFDYYINNFFTGEGIPKYYNNTVFPIDIHTTAQLVVTLVKLNKVAEHKDLLNKVMLWTINNMQSGKGYFYYQVNRYFSSKIPYMRWAQAWMFYAFSMYLKQESTCKG